MLGNISMEYWQRSNVRLTIRNRNGGQESLEYTIATENGNSIAKRVQSTGRETNIYPYCINNIGVRDLKRFFKI